MLIEKSHDLELFHVELKDGIKTCLESQNLAGLWVQKYLDTFNGYDEYYWEISLIDQTVGNDVLKFVEKQGFKNIIDHVTLTDDFNLLDKIMDEIVIIIQDRWKEKDTIHVTTTTYRDYYDMYGINQKDFF